MSTSSQTSSPAKNKNWHKTIAENRGEKWKKNVENGRREAAKNPSNMRLIRNRVGLDQVDIAKKLKAKFGKGFSESTFGAIERGHVKVSGEEAKYIAAILGVPSSKLFRFVKHDKYVAIIHKPTI